MINRIIIQGRLTADPELRYTGNGKAVVKFSVANDIGYGEKKKTSFPTFVAWEKKAEYIGNYAKKGAMLVIDGMYGENVFTDKDGNKRKNVEITVNEVFIPYDSKNASEGANFASQGYENDISYDGYAELADESDLPF